MTTYYGAMKGGRKEVRGPVTPVIAIDRGAATPLHRQIYEAYRRSIVGGDVASGQQVPSSRSLAHDLRVSRIPVLTAYSQLLAEGYFETRAGAGTFVSASLPDRLTPVRNRDEPENKGPGPRCVSERSDLAPARTSAPWTYGSGAFSVGQLAYDHFPFPIWSSLVARHARKVNRSSLNYGDPMGLRDFRETIATYLRTSRAVHCEARQIMVVSGSQQALDLSARVLLDPREPAWVEDPGYELMRHALRMAGCRLVPVPVDEEGMNVGAGKKLCRTARAAYVTPSHQYPLGATMSVSRRLQLLDWARHAGAWIVEDDYDSEYRYESMPIASLQGLDRGARVVYTGTFSKTLFPSLRLGYMVIPPDLIDRFAAVRRVADLCPPQLYQAVLTDFIAEGHFARHIRRTRLLHSERRAALVEAIREVLGSRVSILGSEAGMHLVITLQLPAGMRDLEISHRAAQSNLWLWPLSTTYLERRSARQGFILGFGSMQAADMLAAVRRLREMLPKHR